MTEEYRRQIKAILDEAWAINGDNYTPIDTLGGIEAELRTLNGLLAMGLALATRLAEPLLSPSGAVWREEVAQ